ncbi:MAG TPA: GTP cyclohydrolase I [Ktedonobacterales bacterium]|nr:GTP cyclohydrolase I [Ktedonobacterales bacterium]
MASKLEIDLGNGHTALHLHPRRVSEQQLRKYEGYMAEIFTALGLNVHTSATEDTPRRFVRALYDITDGYEGDPKLLTVFDTECHGFPDCHTSQVIEGPIQFYTLCEHHALPFFGHANVGYIAHEKIIGISKLTRLVRVYAKRFTAQERISQQIAETLEAHHLCTQMRGVRETAPLTRTSRWRGEYATNPALREEFLAMCGVPR